MFFGFIFSSLDFDKHLNLRTVTKYVKHKKYMKQKCPKAETKKNDCIISRQVKINISEKALEKIVQFYSFN